MSRNPEHSWRRRARELKSHLHALAIATRHPDTPWPAKLVAVAVVAYALSPIDLIPDFIPILGYLDDLILLPLGIWLALRMIPPPVWDQCKAQAAANVGAHGRASWIAAILIVLLWAGAAAFAIFCLLPKWA